MCKGRGEVTRVFEQVYENIKERVFFMDDRDLLCTKDVVRQEVQIIGGTDACPLCQIKAEREFYGSTLGK
tara:strand:+ start:1936 stop:2145 length:210 start_codon:yes stop_codon:yes gene_type:complete